MAYNPYKLAYPDIARTRQQVIDEIRYNLLALRDVIAMTGMLPGWDYTPYGGTAEKPQYLYFKRSTYSIRLTLTWGTTGGATDKVEKVLFAFASNETGSPFPGSANGTYENLADEAGYYVLRINYDSSANVTSTA